MTLQTNIRAMKKTLVLIAAAAGLTFAAQPAMAAEGGAHALRDGGFSFEGPFGSFDRNQLQRGYKVYREVCASCRGRRERRGGAARPVGHGQGPS